MKVSTVAAVLIALAVSAGSSSVRAESKDTRDEYNVYLKKTAEGNIAAGRAAVQKACGVDIPGTVDIKNFVKLDINWLDLGTSQPYGFFAKYCSDPTSITEMKNVGIRKIIFAGVAKREDPPAATLAGGVLTITLKASYLVGEDDIKTLIASKQPGAKP